MEYYPNGNLKSKTEINAEGIPNGKYEEYYSNGKLKKETEYIAGAVSDTVYYYYENGIMKKKGLFREDQMVGWWLYYDSAGKLSKKIEYLMVENKPYINQEIFFDNEGNINYPVSSFFRLHINDTLSFGKNIGKVDYFSNSKDFDLQFIYIIIENEYSNGLTKKDTFTDDINKLWFGVNAYKTGKLKIKGIIQEELAREKLINGDSSELVITKKNQYFEKDVYVTEK
jgi:hypothetical protein